MERYNRVAEASSRYFTTSYSTSFGLATKLLKPHSRQHIYNIYGLVRLADEVVDSYAGKDAAEQLEALESEVYAAIKQDYSTNIVVHAFALTAREYGITKALITPFFASMRSDAPGNTYTPNNYEAYIYGSAEVIGLMCLRVFCRGDEQQYLRLKSGASALGSAFQKTNFLRDLAEDHDQLGRFYFPESSFETFDETAKRDIIADILHDFAVARPAIQKLPKDARLAVAVAQNIYMTLLKRLSATPATIICKRRVRVPGWQKLFIATRTIASRGRYA